MVETVDVAAVEITSTGDSGQAVLLARLKELETVMQSKDQKIAELSQERRKQMEEVVDTAIANWLNQLPNLSEATKQSFRKGVDKLAKVSLLHTFFLFRTQLTKKTCRRRTRRTRPGRSSAAPRPRTRSA